MEIENKEKNSFNYIEIGLYVVIIIAALIILVTINSFKVPSSNANNNSLKDIFSAGLTTYSKGILINFLFAFIDVLILVMSIKIIQLFIGKHSLSILTLVLNSIVFIVYTFVTIITIANLTAKEIQLAIPLIFGIVPFISLIVLDIFNIKFNPVIKK